VVYQPFFILYTVEIGFKILWNYSREGVSSLKNIYYVLYGKRLMDIIIALVALIVTLPVNLILAVFTYIDVGLPIIFKQQRVGKDGLLFTIYKFRNMTNETDENGKLLPPRMRVTKFGKFVRACSLDELLQFWNILIGEMSVIGPRPLAIRYMEQYSERQKNRHVVKPGLECPTPKHLDHVRTWEEQLENDVWYVENVSFMLDVWLMFRLVQLTFDRESAHVRCTATKGSAFPLGDKVRIKEDLKN